MAANYIDASTQVTAKSATCLKGKGIKAVGRYYNYGAGSKVLSRLEAQALISQNIAIWVVFEYFNNQAKWFSAALGKKDATRALQCAQEIVGQPEGSAIYFAADYNENGKYYSSNIVPYFRSVNATFKRPDGTMPYRIGVYSDGLVCRRLVEDGLASLTWLSCSSSFTETGAFYSSKKWSIAQHCGAPDLCSIGVDNDETNPADFGQFSTLSALGASHRASTASRLHKEFLANANNTEGPKAKRRPSSRNPR